MSRYKGTFIFGANFEGGSTVPIDARQLVCTYADLTLPATWCFSPVCSSMALYDGMLTVVASGAGSGVYWLCDWTNYTSPSSWVKLGGGTGVGTLTGATNGLSLVGVSGTTVSLGGGLTGNTIINISGKTLTFSGTTGKVLSYVGSSVNYNYSCIDANYITLEAGNGTNYVYYDINRSASTITTWTKGGNLCFSTEKISGSGGCMIISSPNAALFSGATYNGNYRSNFTSYSLVDKGYVDSRGNKICVCYPPTYDYEITDSVVGMIAVSGISTSECVLLPATSVPGIESGHRIIITDVCGNALSVPIIIDGNGKGINGICIDDDTRCAMINTNNGSITFVYNGNFWSAVAFVN
jgi:hypothetical protein